jgi:hypothetical protein
VKNYDPAKEDGSPLYSPESPTNYIDGPGGSNILTDNNEKGVLETSLRPFITGRQEAALGSDHDSHRQGIYATNSIGDND